MWEPYTRSWLEQPSGTEVVMLTATDYRRLTEERQQAMTALETFQDWFEGPCRLDHLGLCQTHMLSQPCNVAVARELLERVKRA